MSVLLAEPNHPVLDKHPMPWMRLRILSGIPSARTRAQVDDARADGQAMPFDSPPDIACHAARHRRVGAVGGLKFVVDQCLTAFDAHANETVGLACGDRRLLCIDDFEDLNVLSTEGEAGKVFRIGLDKVLGNRIEFCHARRPGTLGEREWLHVDKIPDHSVKSIVSFGFLSMNRIPGSRSGKQAV